jgi:hypothetical protein
MTAPPHTPAEFTESWLARAGRLCWLTVVVATVLFWAAWWSLMPGGFETNHPRFWANSVAPVIGLGVALAALAALRVESRWALRWILLVWPAAAFGAAVMGRVLFPVTLSRLWLIPMVASLVMGFALAPLWRGAGRRTGAGGMCLGLFVVFAAAAFVWTQSPPSPLTRPSADALIPIAPDPVPKTTDDHPGVIRLGRATTVHASGASLNVRLSPLSISVNPLLTFLNGSKDGCSSVFACADDRIGPEPHLRFSEMEGDHSCALAYDFPGQGPATLRAHVDPKTESIAVEARSKLNHTVYSHLNAYCDFEVRGHRRLELEFSPCAGVPIEVRKFDHPFGRPARFAFVDQSRTFRVVEATSGEKGPFRALASGRLGPEEPLIVGLRDNGRLIGRISLLDWSAQADTTISPTAGWGVPVNAIEFSLADDQQSSPASIFVTLAGTSVGRGWDCVGHKPGIYRNRIIIEAIRDQASGSAATTDRDRD